MTRRSLNYLRQQLSSVTPSRDFSKPVTLLRTLTNTMLGALALLCASTASAGIIPDGEAWEKWRPAADSRQIELDHGPWGDLLSRYVKDGHPSGINRFDYTAVSDADRKSLNAYVSYLADIDVSQLTVPQQQAYWINLYNALTIELILDNPGVSSIRKIKDGFFSIGPWGKDAITIDGEVLTLNDIEHRILRPLYREPRVHFAVNCASLGCPNLQPEPWRAETLERQYQKAAVAFINHPRGVSITEDRLTLSSIFKWFSEDFGDDTDAVLNWIADFAEPSLAAQLRQWDGRVRYDYDWALNSP